MANLKAMDSDWFGQTYMGRKSKVRTKRVVRPVAGLPLIQPRSASVQRGLIVGGDSSHGEVQPVGRLSVPGSPLRCHRLQAGHHGGSPAAEGGRTVRTGGRLRSGRTGGPRTLERRSSPLFAFALLFTLWFFQGHAMVIEAYPH